MYVEGKMLDGSTSPPRLLATAAGIWFYPAAGRNIFDKSLAPSSPSAQLEGFEKLLNSIASQPPRVSLPLASANEGPATALAARLMADGWHLSPKVLGNGEGFVGSGRFAFDSLWNPNLRQFRFCCALSRQCMGPPGCVHGGCQFTMHDMAATMFCYLHVARDFGAKGGLCVTSSFAVDYKKLAPLDSEFVVDVCLDSAEGARGASRFHLTTKLVSAEDFGCVHSVGRTVFVQLEKPWSGQCLAGGSAAPLASL